MEGGMKDLLLQLAGLGALAVAVAHGVLIETRLFARLKIEPPRARTLLHGICQISTVAWAAGGVLLIATPHVAAGGARPWIVGATCASYVFGAVGNAIASRGRHFGWIAMSAVVALAIAGA
jgi:hypothetical protein